MNNDTTRSTATTGTDSNRDPLTGAPGSHPIGTAAGAVAGGVAAGAAAGTVAGPVGTVVGAAAIVPVFDLLVPDASVLGSEKFPAPSAQVWAGVSRVLAAGVGALHPSARVAIAAGAAIGAALVLLERALPATLGAARAAAEAFAYPEAQAFLERSLELWAKVDPNSLPAGIDRTVILEEAEVAAVPGEAFGAPGHLRFSYALADEDITEGIDRVIALLSE